MIIAPPHMDITLSFLTFDLENDPLLVGEGDCKYDWLDVWDGLPQGEIATRADTCWVELVCLARCSEKPTLGKSMFLGAEDNTHTFPQNSHSLMQFPPFSPRNLHTVPQFPEQPWLSLM